MRTAVAVGAIAIAVTACAKGGRQQVGAQPSWRAGRPAAAAASVPIGPVTIAPSTEPARRYNEPVTAPPPSRLHDLATSAVSVAAQRLGMPRPVADARLFRACAELAEIVPEEGVLGYSLVEFALQRNGIIEPSPHLLVVWGPVDSPEVIIEQLAPRMEEILRSGANGRLGIGAIRRQADGIGAVVFALQASALTTKPIPRSLPAAGSFVLDAVVDRRYRDPEVFVTRDDGVTDRVPHTTDAAGAIHADIRCGARRGRQQVEVTASDASGSTVLANFPVWCAAEPPTSLTYTMANDDAVATTTQDAEQRLLALVNRDREAAGLAPLAWDEKVAQVSRAHSEEMRATKNVAHISPTTGSAADRVRAARIKTALVMENVARAYGVGEAHQGLMNSPGHRANVMSAAATHVGIGAVFGDEVSGRREIFLTQVFTRVPPRVEPARAAVIVLDRIRAAAGGAIGHDAKLASIAQQIATQLGAGKTRDQAYAGVKSQVDSLGNRYLKIGSVITAAADLDAIEGASLISGSKVDDVGVGVAQGTHAEIGEGAIWVVVLVANKRTTVR